MCGPTRQLGGKGMTDGVWITPPCTHTHMHLTALDDHTRVKLNREASHDYINASYVVSLGGIGFVSLKVYVRK